MKNSTLVVLQARMSSTRLPGKVLSIVNGQPMIYWQLERIKQAKLVSKIVVAISEQESDDHLAQYLGSIRQDFTRGSLDNVLSRYMLVEEVYKSNAIVRLTADCPLVMPELIDLCIKRFYEEQIDYLSNTLKLSYPDGLDVEIIGEGIFKKLSKFDLSVEEKEHVTLGIHNRLNDFSTANLLNIVNLSHFRWTVDTKEDLDFVIEVYKNFKSNEIQFNFQDVLNLVASKPSINRIKHR